MNPRASESVSDYLRNALGEGRKMRLRWLRGSVPPLSFNPDEWPWRFRVVARIEGRVRYWLWRLR